MSSFRVTVLILGLLLGLAMFIQTTLVYSLSSVFGSQAVTDASAYGVVMAVLWLIAVSLAFPLPVASVGVFVLAGIIGFIAAPNFPDLLIWAGVSLVLAGVSALAWREKTLSARELAEDKALNRAVLRSQLASGGPPPQGPGPATQWQPYPPLPGPGHGHAPR